MRKKLVIGLGIVAIMGVLGGIGMIGGFGRSQVLLATKKPDYTFVFIGDSMTEYLGNFDELQSDLKKYYPNKNFLLLNYGFGSTNILSVQDRIEKESTHAGRVFQPIENIDYDAIFIESMGNNPLSQFKLEEGLKKQDESLNQIVSILLQKHPQKPIVFIVTIAPNKDHYGEGVVVLQPDQKKQWVSERVSYMQNHLQFAKEHGIPVVDIYDKSLDKNGDGNIDYLNGSDFIHPSPTGIYFISQNIADFIYHTKIAN